MRTLKPFAPHSVSVHGLVERQGEKLHFKFSLSDPNQEILDSLTPGEWTSWPRADELWKTTCLEAFFSLPGQSGYWELNLSPSKKSWNIYRFDNYRFPQPPRVSEDFELSAIKAEANTLECVLKANSTLGPMDVNLNAVIRTKDGTAYFALAHALAKPDFHHRESFVWKI